jgi:hypothetical protein
VTPKADIRAGRRRAKAVEGERTTLRVPRRLEQPLTLLMSEQGVTRNEALVALADRGAEAIAAERRVAAARERLARAVLSPAAAGGLPSPEAVEEAIVEARGGRA